MDLNQLLLFALAGLATFLIRLSFIALLGRMAVPPWVRQVLPYVPTAALTAIIVPELLMRGDVVFLSVGNTRLIAGARSRWIDPHHDAFQIGMLE